MVRANCGGGGSIRYKAWLTLKNEKKNQKGTQVIFKRLTK